MTMRRPEPCSPCRQLCRLNRAGVCIGCGRTAPEIRDWLSLDVQARWSVLRRASERRSKLDPRTDDA